MRIRMLVAAALVALPAAAPAQILRVPRRGVQPEPAPLPPAAAPVERALAIKRSRWTGSAYALFSAIDAPNGSGGISRYALFGNGMHGDYRVTDHWNTTFDVTASYFGGTSQTAELGMRYSPYDWTSKARPFFDVRGGYMRLSDSYVPSNLERLTADGARFSSGFGGIAGTGVEYSITSSFSLMTEILALRNRMSVTSLSATSEMPFGSRYTMVSYRLAVGLTYNPMRTSSQPTR